MLTPRENLLETIHGGKPDRYVNQFEALALQCFTPRDVHHPWTQKGKGPVKNAWGVWFEWPDNTPGEFPLHDSKHLLIKDIEHWRDYVTIPETVFPAEEWAEYVRQAKAVDRKEQFVTAFMWPGVFENCHHMLGMENCLLSLYTDPESMHELIEAIVEYELGMAKEIVRYLHPDALYRHDDWGSQISTLMSREMFREFYLEPTKKIYKFWRDNGVELIVHHSDSYGETLVPDMVEMGIDIWQGALSTNDLPRIAREYKGKLTVMGGMNNGIIDKPDWTREAVYAEVNRVLDWVDSEYFIPCCTQGGSGSTFKGVYAAVTDAVNDYNNKKWRKH